MGICFSTKNKESSSPSSSSSSDIRVVHYNGYLESFRDPITVGQVTANVPNHFLCTPTQLMIQDFNKLLKPDTELAPGHIYLLLPYSALRSEASTKDLALMSKKLTMIAKTGRSLSSSPSSSSEGSPDENSTLTRSCGHGRYADLYKVAEVEVEVEVENVVDWQVSKKSYRWKPRLSTIVERSVSRGSESDLQENYVSR